MNIVAGATRTPEYLAINPSGKIPLLMVPGRGPIAESHAIINFLAEGTPLMPADKYERALVWQWLGFEQYQLEPGVATVRFWLKSLKKTPEELGEKYVERFQRGAEALAVLEKGLTGRRWLVGENATLADIALFAYTHVADEAGLPLRRLSRDRRLDRGVQAAAVVLADHGGLRRNWRWNGMNWLALPNLLEQIRDNQSEQLARQREALEFQRSQLELVRRQSERTEKIQDRAEELQARGAGIMTIARRSLAIVLPVVILLIAYLTWLIFR
jgi:glutathione S-transferase